jgi:hypothetical protein
LYSIHLEAVAYWDRSWKIIEDSIYEKLELEIDKKYESLNKKLENLNKKQNSPQESEHKTTAFFQRVKNLSSVNFNTDEIGLLSKGLQYNLTYKNTNQWLENLIIETEAAKSRLPIQDQEGFRYLARQNIDKITNKNKSIKTNNKLEYGSIKLIRSHHKISKKCKRRSK